MNSCSVLVSTLLLAVAFAGSRFAGSESAYTVAIIPTTDSSTTWWQPSASDNLKWQLQLQGDLRQIPGVNVYAVDSQASQASLNAAKANGAKLMCYISAGSAEEWRQDFAQFPDSIVGNAYDGWPGEWWLDIRRIEQLAPVMRARMDFCAAKGFDVLDADNINGFENDTGFALTRSDAITYVRWLAAEAHHRGMSFSLKNGEALLDELSADIDMMQSESCYYYDNCSRVARLSELDKPVFAVEYETQISRNRFHQSACQIARNNRFFMIYREVELLADGVYLSCR